MKKLKAVLFDVDGTFADTENQIHLPAFNQAFEEFKLNWHWHETEYLDLLKVTGGMERIRHYLDTHKPDCQYPIEESAWIADLHKCKTKYCVEIMASGKITLRPGVIRLIHEIRENPDLRMAIVTTTSPENVTALLEPVLGKGCLDWFDLIAGGEMVENKKPAPDIYQFTLDKMNWRADEVIAIEDSRNGILSAQGAQIKTLITECSITHGQDFTGATLVVDQLGEPDAPFKVLEGNAGQATFANIALLEQLIQN